jgi:site-specific recombinase XerD
MLRVKAAGTLAQLNVGGQGSNCQNRDIGIYLQYRRNTATNDVDIVRRLSGFDRFYECWQWSRLIEDNIAWEISCVLNASGKQAPATLSFPYFGLERPVISRAISLA